MLRSVRAGSGRDVGPGGRFPLLPGWADLRRGRCPIEANRHGARRVIWRGGRTIGKQKGRQTLGEVLGFFLWLVGVVIIALLLSTEEGLVRQEQLRIKVQEEAQRRLDAERQWPNSKPWDTGRDQRRRLTRGLGSDTNSSATGQGTLICR